MTTTHTDNHDVLTNQKRAPFTPTPISHFPGTNEDNGEDNNNEMKDDIEVDETTRGTAGHNNNSSPSSSNKRRKLDTKHHERKDEGLLHLKGLLRIGTSRDVKWISKYEELEQYINNNDGKYPNTKHKEFGNWILIQRRNYRNKNQCMAHQKVELLEKLNTWSWGVGKQKPMKNNNGGNNKSSVRDKMWITKYNQLVQYVNKNNDDGTIYPIVLYKNKQFGSWIKQQREAYRNKHKSMTNYRIQLLEKIDTWSWGKARNNNNGYGNFVNNNNRNNNDSSKIVTASSRKRKRETTRVDNRFNKGTKKN